ncbi:MAG: endolytic transglycosylase MltG [Cyanobacteria bacterium P01_A01_bin.135]
MSTVVRGLFYFLLLPAALLLSGWQGWRWWSWAVATGGASGAEVTLPEDAADDSATNPATAPATVQLTIEPGTSAQQIGYDLRQVGAIRSLAAWNLWTRLQELQGREGGFLAGTYEIAPEQPMAAIAEQIWQGDVVQGSLTIPEGWSVEDIVAYLVEQELGSETEVREAMRQIDRTEFRWLPDESYDQPEQRFEGFLYPDTYVITEAATPEQVIRQMLQQFEALALPVYEQGSSPYSLLEWVTLASIVEREAVVDEERQTIASVFARRLEEGIPLGADPTVEYALGIRQTPERPLTYAQVETDSPYNTYVNAGLPPGPIANPGVESLKVSLDPPDTEFLYFVARYDGTHVFSRTLGEHQRAQGQIRDRIDRPGATDPSSTSPSAPESDSPQPGSPEPDASQPDSSSTAPST